MSVTGRTLDVGRLGNSFFKKRRAARELATLIDWPESLRGKFAIAVAAHENHGEVYWNFKLGCFSGIVSGAKDGWPDYREAALKSILKAFRIIDDQRPTSPKSSVTALISWPNMFNSEICINFTKEHETRFTPETFNSSHGDTFAEYGNIRTKTTTPEKNPYEKMNVQLPSDLEIGGYHLLVVDEDEGGEEQHSELWSVMRKNHRLSDKTTPLKAIKNV